MQIRYSALITSIIHSPPQNSMYSPEPAPGSRNDHPRPCNSNINGLCEPDNPMVGLPNAVL